MYFFSLFLSFFCHCCLWFHFQVTHYVKNCAKIYKACDGHDCWLLVGHPICFIILFWNSYKQIGWNQILFLICQGFFGSGSDAITCIMYWFYNPLGHIACTSCHCYGLSSQTGHWATEPFFFVSVGFVSNLLDLLGVCVCVCVFFFFFCVCVYICVCNIIQYLCPNSLFNWYDMQFCFTVKWHDYGVT